MPGEKVRLPLCVFLDTQVYRATSFDWDSGNFIALRERVTKGSIRLVTTEIIRQEIRRGILELLNEFTQDLRKIRHVRLVRQLGHEPVDAIRSISEAKLDSDKLWATANKFLSDLQTTILEPPASAFNDLFELYFSGSPPFGSKGKKSEFPDAANLLTLEAHAKLTGERVFVVSGDGDWKRACENHSSLILVEHLSAMIDKAIRAEWRSDDLWSDDELLQLLAAQIAQLKPMLQKALARSSRVNLGDGSVENLELDDVELLGLAITDIKDGEEEITLGGELFHEVHYWAAISVPDDEMLNTIEHELSGRTELVAKIRLVLSLNQPNLIRIKDVSYDDGLELEVPLKY